MIKRILEKSKAKQFPHILVTLTTIVLASSHIACGPNDSLPNSVPNSENPISPNRNNSKKVPCKNPINLEDNKLIKLTKATDFPKSRFRLGNLEVYFINEELNQSFTVSANERARFSVKLYCSGVSEDFIFESNIIAEIDNLTSLPPKMSRSLDLKFQNGKLISANSNISPAVILENFLSKGLPLDRFKDGDKYVTLRAYSISDSEFELRIKTETPGVDGKKGTVQVVRATFFDANSSKDGYKHNQSILNFIYAGEAYKIRHEMGWDFSTAYAFSSDSGDVSISKLGRTFIFPKRYADAGFLHDFIVEEGQIDHLLKSYTFFKCPLFKDCHSDGIPIDFNGIENGPLLNGEMYISLGKDSAGFTHLYFERAHANLAFRANDGSRYLLLQ